jgi:putative DNA primase/helicase
VTNGYYRILYNSEMSHSSAVVTYRPEGAGQKPRRAVFDLALIPDPETWLTARLGRLATFVRELDADTSVAAARRAALHDLVHTLAAIASTTQPQPNPSEQETHP